MTFLIHTNTVQGKIMTISYSKFIHNTFLLGTIFLLTILSGCVSTSNRPAFSGAIGIKAPDTADHGERVPVHVYLKQALRKGDVLRVVMSWLVKSALPEIFV
jgi:hypothetical protein